MSRLQTVALFIADELHLTGSDVGPTYEIIVSLMRYIAHQTKNQIRIVCLSTSLANARRRTSYYFQFPS